ncbi:FAD-dependent oxidoreductase [Crenobacter sp. SG2303]|uniref:FAD-dependent oxidoreductase n=1 Tax=Crenobacter oryzisoli TaxID=3056844 RepID=A0ABT7XUJ2_9NEIS|nr:FAD-dependent oxidoreductase [Crenobacter sp. SG2303]MDN0077456.1 FAD-dependent oxidoreductase [Crenobacter sp. SG2303]
MRQNKDSYDVVVVGSGAGALASAIAAHAQGLSVLVVEKSDRYGGTSAVSGGGVWIPCNHQIAALGGEDNRADALTYLKSSTRGMVAEAKLEAYVDNAASMLRWFEEHTHVRFRSLPLYADYYQALPGSRPGYRTMDPEAFDAAELGEEFFNMREPSPGTLVGGRLAMTAADAHRMVSKEKGWMKLLGGLMARYWLDIAWRRRTRRDRRLALGNALIGRLRRTMLDRNIPLWLNTALVDLVERDGRISGLVIEHKGQRQTLTARRGVILGAGGFERNQALRERFLPNPTQSGWTAAPPTNTGDALLAGLKLGAATDLTDHAWWAPTMHVPGEEKQRALFMERALPGCVMVNGQGRRFVNEAAPYTDIVYAMYDDHARTGRSVPAWLVFDARFRSCYPIGPLLPGMVQPDFRVPEHWWGTMIHRATTLDALAEQIGVDAAGLADTVARMNGYAERGEDLEFGKGGNAFDRYYGDPDIKPNPCLAPILKAPFYAVRVDAGDIGTKGGLLTDEYARVLREDGSAIVGLYAIGNTAASVMGPTYPGAGSTLGPAMTFGYIAAHHLAAQQQTGPTRAEQAAEHTS